MGARFRLRANFDLSSYSPTNRIILQALKQAQADLDRARSDAAAAQKLDEEVERLLQAGTSIDSIPQVVNNSLIREMRKSLAEKEALLANLLKRYKDKYPDVIRTREEVA